METNTMGYTGHNIGDYMGIMENETETTIVGYMGYTIGDHIWRMENNMETTIGFGIYVWVCLFMTAA